MANNIKKVAKAFMKKHALTLVNYPVLKKAAINMGYTVIEFNNILNEEDVETIIRELNLGEKILKSRGFTYATTEYRLIFINEDLNDDEKLLVLSHEIGHIVCGHMSATAIIGNDVKEEYEANEFSHYLLKQNSLRNLMIAIAQRKRMVTAFAVVLFFVLALGTARLIIDKEKSYYGDFYITTTGDKYHKKDCIFVKDKTSAERLTQKAFEAEEYEPCDICLPDK